MDPKSRYNRERLDNKQNRLSLILESAESVFLTKGIEKTTMQNIAKDANIGIATLFRYFPKKEKLIVAVATQLIEPMLYHFQSIADMPLSCLEKLDQLFDFFINDHINHKVKLMVDFENYAAHSTEPLEDILKFNELNRLIFREYEKIIEQGLQDGSLRSDLPIKDTLITVINTFALFSKRLSVKKNILLLDSDVESDVQLIILKKILIDHLKA